MKICHIISSLEVGGAERFALRLAHAQREAGHAVSLVALRGGPLEAEAAARGLAVRICGGGRGWKAAAEYLGYSGKRRFDLVHSHNPQAHRFAVLTRLWRRPAVVMTLHGEVSRCYGRLLTGDWTDRVVAVSERVQRSLLAKHPDLALRRVRVIENGVAVEAPSAADRARLETELQLKGMTTLVVVARLDPIKDLQTLLRAFQQCAPRERQLALLIVGDGPCRAELEQLAGELGVADSVRFLGFRTDIPALLALSDLFVLSSVSEGMPLSILEAMAAGLPVVATAVGGIPEVVADGSSGLLVPPRSPEALARALVTLAGDPALRDRMGCAGRQRIDERFSFAAMVARYDALYAEILARPQEVPCFGS